MRTIWGGTPRPAHAIFTILLLGGAVSVAYGAAVGGARPHPLPGAPSKATGKPAFAGASATLQAQGVSKGSVARLGDVARIAGELSAAQRLAAVELGPAPLPGGTRTLSAEYVRIRLRQQGIPDAALAAGSAFTCKVTRSSQALSGDAILLAARTWLESSLPAGDARRVVEPISRPRERQLPDGAMTTTVEPFGSSSGPTRQAMVKFSVDGEPAGQELVSLRVREYVKAAVAKAAIPRGESVTPDRVTYEERDRAALPTDAFLESDGLDGLTALNSISAGAPITRRNASEPAALHRGDTVTIQVKRGGITVSAPGLALEDGRMGASVRVKNTTSNAEVRGILLDGKTVDCSQ